MSMLRGFTNLGCPVPFLGIVTRALFLAVSSRLNAWRFSNAGHPST